MMQDFEDRQRDRDVKALDRLFGEGIAFIAFCGACVLIWYQWLVPLWGFAESLWRKL